MILKSWGRRSRSKEEERSQGEASATPAFRHRPVPAEGPDALDGYLRRLIASLAEAPAPGFSANGEGPLRVSFEAVYVPPTLSVVRDEAAGGPADRREGEGEDGDEEGEEGDRHIGVGEALSRRRHLIVLGGRGAGKTALLQYLALTFARRLARQRLGLEEGYLPVFLPSDRVPEEVAPRRLCHAAGWDGDPEVGEAIFARYLEQGRVALLIDGPAAESGAQTGVLDRAGLWARAYPVIRCVVTGDARAYEAAPPPSGFLECRLDPSGLVAAEGMAYRWFREVEAGLRPDGDADRAARRRVLGLTAAARRSAGAWRLWAVPGHLRRMALVHLHRSDLPGSDLDLVREYTDVVAGSQGGADGMTPAERLLPAQRAALWEAEGGGEATLFEARVADALREVDGEDATDRSSDAGAPEAWIRHMAAAGLIEGGGGGGWRFCDPLCRDYLAAREVCRTSADAGALVRQLREKGCFHLIVWCAGLHPDTPSLLRAVLAQEETAFREALRTAARCLTYGRGLGEAARREVCAALVGLCQAGGYGLLRRWALDLLGEMGAEEAVPEFVAQGRGADPLGRERACEALGRIGGPAAVAALSDMATHDAAAPVRAAACRALGRIGSDEAADPLARLALESEDAPVRAAACRALGRIGSEKVLNRMLEALGDRRASVRGGAALALGQIGDRRAVPPLLEAMSDEYSSVRWRAVQALGAIRSEEALEALGAALTDEDWAVRREACAALGLIGSGAVVKPLIEALKDGYSSVRRAACEALGRIGAESAASALIRSLRDEDWAVRRAACEALARIRSDAAVEPLLRGLRDRDAFVRAAGAEILGWIDKGRSADLLARALRDDEYSSVRRAACEALSRAEGERYTDALRAALKDSASSVRRAAVRGLCLRRPPDLHRLLAPALRDSDEEVREGACEALGGVGDAEAGRALIGALGDASPAVRRVACEALGRSGDAGCIPPLCGLLKDSDASVRDAAFEALWRVCRRTGRTVYLKDL
jgi:HEAT repeat protein